MERTLERSVRAGWVGWWVIALWCGVAFGQVPGEGSAPGGVLVEVASEPSEASVFLRYTEEEYGSDRFLGRTPADGSPLALELEPGAAEVIVYKDGFVCRVEALELRPGVEAHVEVQLIPDVEVPGGLVLWGLEDFSRSMRESQEVLYITLAQIVRYYVEEVDPRELVESAVETLVEALNAIRARELLLSRELSEPVRRRYYGQELDLSGYPPLEWTRGESEDGRRSYRLGAGGVGVEGVTDEGELDTYLDMLDQAYAFVHHQWDQEGLLSHSALVRCLVEGLLLALGDPHTHFLDPSALADMHLETEGSFGGVGVTVSVRDGRLLVMGVMGGTPAAVAGVREGDWIVAIDGERLERVVLQEAVGRIRGPVDTPVELTVRRGEEEETITVVRGQVALRTVESGMVGSSVGYVRIASFMNGHLVELVQEAVDELVGAGAERLVLDLRGNPGGLLEQARLVADLFVPEGPIVSTRTRVVDAAQTYDADPSRRKYELPLAVLIDEGSASAAEILAGTLEHYDLAVLVGTTSFGKGSVQRVRSLEPYNCALALTIATYHLPSGETPHNRGVEPNVRVELSEDDVLRLRARGSSMEGGTPRMDAQLEAALQALQQR